MTKSTNIYRVEFKTAPYEDGKTDYYFTSLAAIYDRFTPAQIGCAVQRLWELHISDGVVYKGRKTTITRETIASKSQSKPNNRDACGKK